MPGLNAEQRRAMLRAQVAYLAHVKRKPWAWIVEHTGVSETEARYLYAEFFDECVTTRRAAS